MKLCSLFSGSGGFELAGAMCVMEGIAEALEKERDDVLQK